jgi:Tol biopolymer transport system component
LSTLNQPGLFLLSPDTGEIRRIATGSLRSPAVSPDGHRIAFIQQTDLTIGDVYLINLSSDLIARGKPERLTQMNEKVASYLLAQK